MHYIEESGMIKDKILKIFALFTLTALLSGAMDHLGDVSLPIEIEADALEISYNMTESYKSGRYYENLTALDLSGDEARDVLAIAMSQVGYHEGNSDGELDGLGISGSRDFVEYNVLYGRLDNNQGNGMSYGYYWCASFVNWCLRMAGVDKDASGSEVSCERWYADARQMGIYRSKSGYIPSSGDIIFFKDRGSSMDSTHVGIVRYSDGKNVYTVEGNTSNGSEYSSNGEYVALKQYSLSNSYIVGYASPKYEENKTARRVDYSGSFRSLGDYISESEIKIYGDGAFNTATEKVIPVYSVFKVTEISGEYIKVSLDGAEGYVKSDSPITQLTTSEGIYTVNYVGEDGGLIYLPQYRRADEQKSVYSNAPSREKSGFVGWKIKESPDKVLAPGEQIPVMSADVTLEAIFDTNYYVISFKNEDGTLISQAYGYYGTEFSFPDAPEAPEGFVFAGWDAKSDGVITGNASYTATFISEDELESAGVGGESNESISGLDGGSVRIIAIAAAGAVALAAAIIITTVIVKKKKKNQ